MPLKPCAVRSLSFAACAAALLPTAAPAQEVVAVDKAKDWVVTITGNGAWGSSYWGAKSKDWTGFPSIALRQADQPAEFEAPDDGFSFALFGNPGLKVGVVGRYMAGRYNSEDDLQGTASIPWGLNVGGFVEYWPLPMIRTRFDVLHGVKGNYGWSSNIEADYVQPWNKFTFSLGPRLVLGDDTTTDTYFGVNERAAFVNPKLTAYDPSGGITSVGALAAVNYEFDDNWSTAGYVRYDRLVGSAADSPIVKNIGSPNQVVVGMSVSYTFGLDLNRAN